MKSLSIARHARPQVQTLLIALAVTIVLWFIPFAGILTYPFRLFVTFIHEGGHALAALLTGNQVFGLQVAPNGSGLTYTSRGNVLAQMLVSSAGYLGAMAYGALLLVLIRRAVAARAVLTGSAIFVLALTLFYGLHNPFTIVAGLLLAAALLAVARYAQAIVANFLVAFLAVQCVVGALFDLRTLLFLSAPFSGAHTDAENMARTTHLPALFWALIWMVLAVVFLVGALRAYARGGTASRSDDGAMLPTRRRYSV